MPKIFNTKHNAIFRSELRKNMTEPERRLWSKLRGKQLGVKFRRQFGIGQYIVDFYCASEKLVIELDGAVHNTPQAQEYDRKRTEVLNKLGFTVIRFENKMVFENLESVLLEISEHFQQNSKSSSLNKGGGL